MKNALTVIELSNKYIKIVIGKVNEDGQVIVHYSSKTPIDHLIENGSFVDKDALLQVLSKINPIDDKQYKIHELISDAALVLPPYGLEIFSTNQFTGISSNDRTVGKQDVFNLYNIINNKKLPVENDIVDIVPVTFTIDSGEKFVTPPYGKASRNLIMQANVVTLPKRINADYQNLLLKAGINVTHKVVSSYGVVELLKTYNDIAKQYFLIDIGAFSTSVSLVTNGFLQGTRSFAWGGDTITERIIECFNINEKEANRLKFIFGLDDRKMNFAYPITGKNNNDPKHYREELNKIITDSLDVFINSFVVSLEKLAEKYKIDNYRSLPIYLVGGGAKLHGLLGYLKQKLNKDNISILSSRSIGARDSSFMACLGAILVDQKHPGLVEDIISSSTPISRED